jgi:hypothetical protein
MKEKSVDSRVTMVGMDGVVVMANIAELQEKYFEITELYDLAEELVDTVESEFVQNPGQQYELIEPLAEGIGEAADVLSEEFMAIAEGKGKRNKTRIEGALRKIYMAMESYNKRAQAIAGEASTGFRNIADPIVKKIKRQLETVIATFIEFVDLSLDRIMHKSEIEELKQRQEKIALMLHNVSQQAT